MVEACGREAAAFAAEKSAGAESLGRFAGGGDVAGDPDFGIAGLGHCDQGRGGANHVHDGADAAWVGCEGSRKQFDSEQAHRRMVCQRPEAKRASEAPAIVR